MTILSEPDVVHSDSLFVLKVLGALLDRENIAWWIDYGTLLGYVRDGGFIAHDSDIDIGIFGSDLPLLVNMADQLHRYRFATCYHPPNEGEFNSGHWFHVTRRHGNPNGVDVFPWYSNEEGSFYRMRYCESDRKKGREFPFNMLLPFQLGEFEGVPVWVPAKPEELVELRYGADWQTPVDYRDGIPGDDDQ